MVCHLPLACHSELAPFAPLLHCYLYAQCAGLGLYSRGFGKSASQFCKPPANVKSRRRQLEIELGTLGWKWQLAGMRAGKHQKIRQKQCSSKSQCVDQQGGGILLTFLFLRNVQTPSTIFQIVEGKLANFVLHGSPLLGKLHPRLARPLAAFIINQLSV